ncbi:MAG: helix-turn-helix domain-containing protein [Polyangiaceae bacterium]|nr:helix-turn-helix domain-containing protein [Polyangiaceae bacterium]
MSSSLKGPRPAQGAFLLALRRAAGLTQVGLAKALGVSNTWYRLLGMGAQPPPLRCSPALARALRVRVERSSAPSGLLLTRPIQASAHLQVRSLPRRHRDTRRAFRRHPPRAAQSQLGSSVLPSLL